MRKQKLTSRQEQAIKTRNKIYKVAIDLMEKKGFDNFTIEDICKKAGVSVGAFYHYFKSKNDILIEIFKRADDYFRNEAPHIQEKITAPEQVLTFFRYYAKYDQQNGIETVKQLYDANNKFFIAKGRYMQMLLQDIIARGQGKNEFTRDMSPEQFTEYLFVIARGIVFDWCLHEGEYDLEEATTRFFESIIGLHTVHHS